MSFLVVLPSVHPPSTQRCVETMATRLWERVVIVDNAHGTNRGVAASWNVGARRALAEGVDWLVVCSGATRFGPAGGTDLADLLAAADPAATWVVEADAPVGWHLVSWSARLLAAVGLFDENYWAYGEDADMCLRVHQAQREGWGGAWVTAPLDAWITMQGHAVKLAGVRPDYPAIAGFHRAKWGCDLGSGDGYARPFDDPALPLSWWPTPPDPRSTILTAV